MTAPRRPRSAWLLVGSTPSVWADDPVVAFAEHGLGFGGVPAGRDPEDRCAAGERAPEHAAVAAGLPAGLVDVDDRRALDLLLQPRVRGGERLAGALDDCVHRPGRDLNPEQLPGELGCVTPRDAVTHRERGDRRLEPRPERPPRPGGRLGRGHSRARRAAHPVQPMLAHPDRDRRQLGDLTPGRPGRVDTIRLGELVRTRPAPVGPMLDDLVDLFGREQPPVPALVSVLPAPLAARPLPAWTWRRRRRILRRRQRRVPRTPIQPTLELGHPSLEALVRIDQPLVRLDQLVKPKQQTDRRLTITIQDRLRLGPLHPRQLRRNTAGPCAAAERLQDHGLQAYPGRARVDELVYPSRTLSASPKSRARSRSAQKPSSGRPSPRPKSST